jgi:hypothetical protein
MPEAEVVEQTEAEIAAAQAAFDSGFDSDAPPAKETPPPAAAAEAPPPVREPPKAPVPPAPKYVRLTEDEAQRLRSAADETVNLKQQLSKAFGTLGNMQQVINQIRNQTPAGATVEITDADFAELREDFPELEQRQRVGLERILKRANLRGTAQVATPTIDPEHVRSVAATIIHGEGLKDLDDLHPGWREFVGQPGDTDNVYRRWLATQPPEYQHLLANTYSAAITKRSIDKCYADMAKARAPAAVRQQTPARTDTARRDRIQAAVAPRGNGHAPAPRSPTPEELFRQGFNE